MRRIRGARYDILIRKILGEIAGIIQGVGLEVEIMRVLWGRRG